MRCLRIQAGSKLDQLGYEVGDHVFIFTPNEIAALRDILHDYFTVIRRHRPEDSIYYQAFNAAAEADKRIMALACDPEQLPTGTEMDQEAYNERKREDEELVQCI